MLDRLPSIRSLVDPVGNKEVFVSVFPFIGHPSTVHDVIQDVWNSVVESTETLELHDMGLDIVTKPVVEYTLVTVM